MNKLKTIVVEDERLPRLSLLAKLEEFNQVLEIADDCDSYESARDSILLHHPDLLFLDIQLNGRDSIQLLEELGKTLTLPYIIFTTAYSDRKYLMSAIKLSAVDYLLKPVGKAELSHAIAKALSRAGRTVLPDQKAGKLNFRSVNSRLFVDPEDIACFKADGNYSTLVTFDGSEMILENLRSLQQRLPAGMFVRTDRSTIINTDKLYKLNLLDRSCTLRSGDGREIEVKLSKSAAETLMSLQR